MPTRRDFLTHAASAGIAGPASVHVANAAGIPPMALAQLLGQVRKQTPYGKPFAAGLAPQIKSVLRRNETTLRLGGEGDNFHMSWAADDRQLVMVDDGWGWIEDPQAVYNNRLFTITGEPEAAIFEELVGYPEALNWGKRTAYHGFGTLAVDGRIYQFLSNLFRSVKLIYSIDNGRTWCNQNGSSPVVWEPRERQSRESMVFFEQPQMSFSLLTILQMGKNYEANADGYVYVYAPNGITEGTMNELVMFRVPKTQVVNPAAYEYFAALRPDGSATWVKDINGRGIVHTFPRGWVNKQVSWRHPYAWHPSVVYNSPLGLYMMANWGNGASPDGVWFSKPSYLGFWTAPSPWGPWTQIHEETAWMPAGDALARAYQPQIAPKWISNDGKSFWLVWTDWQQTSEFEPLMLEAVSSENLDECVRLLRHAKRYRPYYGMNVQRVDLVVA